MPPATPMPRASSPRANRATPRQPYPGTQAVLRAVRLLKAFTRERPEWRVADLARSVALNKTTTYRLLSALESEGMVERAGEGDSFRLGPALIALGSRALGAADLRAAARAELQALARHTRETVTLEALAGRDTLILDEAMGSHVVGMLPAVGTRWPAHTTSTGKAILAHLAPPDRDAWVAGPLPAVTGRTITRRGDLERELARARDRGWATSVEELEPALVAVGAPVFGAAGDVVAALSVSGPKSRLPASRVGPIARTIVQAARRVSARLGHEHR